MKNNEKNMQENNNQSERFQQLREKARELFEEQRDSGVDSEESSIGGILTEQEIRQIELEMQNEELQHARRELEKTNEKYRSLFMFAPVGYFILNDEGYISEVNLTGADMLKMTRNGLVNRKFTGFVAAEERDSYKRLLSQSSESRNSAATKLHLVKEGGESFLTEVVCDTVDDFDGKVETLRLTVIDIFQNEELQQLEKKSSQLKKLSAHLNQVREEERETAAKLIHDELGQSLTAMKMDLVWVRNQIPGEKNSVREKLDEMIQSVETNIYSVQKITAELRPGMIHELGLVAAIEWEIETIRNRVGIQCEFRPDFDDTALDNIIALDIYRIIKELITNAVRHSEATALFLEISRESDSMKIRFSDNGKGTTVEELNASDAFGIMSIKERVNNYNGDVEFDTDLSVGFEVRISLPVFNGK